MGINKQEYSNYRLEEAGISREESMGMHIIDEEDLMVEELDNRHLFINTNNPDEFNHEMKVQELLNIN